MSDQTLWGLAQSWDHEQELEGISIVKMESTHVHDEAKCRRCQLEQWARERAKEWEEAVVNTYSAGRVLFAERAIDDLGVPTEEI